MHRRVTPLLLAAGLLVVSIPCAAHDEPPETVLLLHLDETEGNVAQDASGLGNDGDVLGDCEWTEGRFGGAVAFAGDGHVRVGRPPALDFGKTTDFTVECWINVPPETEPGFSFIISNRLRMQDTPGYSLYLHPNYRLLATVGDKVNWIRTLAGAEPLNDGQWHHIALTCDRDGEATLFVDGEKQDAADMSFLVTVSNTSLPLRIGSRGHARDFIGRIDEVRISRGVRAGFSLDAPYPADGE